MAQSAIIDMAGGVVARGSSAPAADASLNQFQVTFPGLDRLVIDLDEIGASDGPQYIKLTKENYGLVAGRVNSQQRFVVNADGTPAATSRMEGRIPDLIDPDGLPILMWQQDPLAPADADFASIWTVNGNGTPPGATPRPKFTWTSNVGVLCADSLGPFKVNQATQTLLGWSAGVVGGGRGATAGERINAMQALLGNPQFATTRVPVSDFGTFNTENPNAGGVPYPTTAKGEIVLHAAGPDGFYLRRPNGPTPVPQKLVYGAIQDPAVDVLIDSFDDFTESQ